MSLTLNILITVLIVLRLLVYRHRIVQALGKGQGSQYTSLAAMIIESAAIYSTFALLFIVPFALSSQLAQLFLQGLSLVQVCYSLLLSLGSVFLTSASLSRVYPPSSSFSVLQPVKVGRPRPLLVISQQVCSQFGTGPEVPSRLTTDHFQRSRHRGMVIMIKISTAVTDQLHRHRQLDQTGPIRRKTLPALKPQNMY